MIYIILQLEFLNSSSCCSLRGKIFECHRKVEVGKREREIISWPGEIYVVALLVFTAATNIQFITQVDNSNDFQWNGLVFWIYQYLEKVLVLGP